MTERFLHFPESQSEKVSKRVRKDIICDSLSIRSLLYNL